MTDRPEEVPEPGEPEPAQPPDSSSPPDPAASADASTDASDDPADEAREQDEAPLDAATLARDVGQRRKIREAGRASLGSAWFRGDTRFAGTTSLGGHAAGRDVNIFVAATQRAVPETGVIGPAQLQRAQSVHVSGPSYARTEEVLQEERLVVLRGAAGTGKRTTALFALGQVAPATIHAIRGRQALDASADSGFQEHAGHLAECPAPPELTYATLAALSRDLNRLDSYLAVTVPASAAADAETTARFVVDHDPPHGEEVVNRHLSVDGGNDAPAARRLMRSGSALACVTTPGMAAYLSSRMLTITREGGPAADAARVADEIRRWRVHQLIGSERPDSDRERVEVLCRRAALASVAVFTGLPYADAVLAAEALAARFIAIEFPPSHGREIFIPWRGRLLSEPDIVIERSDNLLRWGASPAQQLRFADPDFHAAVLEEIWEHYDAARSPLLLWLRELAVSSADEAIRIRAAQVIGRLAIRDFGHVCHRVLLDLSGSVNRRAREAAALALEAIAEIMAQLVWNLLTEWCQDGNQHRQHTAVLALGTGIGEHDPGATLAQLRSLAIRNIGRGTQAMAEAVRRSVIGLFSGPHPVAVIRALRQWAIDPDPRLHALACRSVPPLAHVIGSSRRPLLLAVLADQPRLRADAVTLIAAALDDARTRQEAWTALENLVVAAADDARLTDTVGELLRDLRRVSATAERQVHFYLLVWACRHQALTRSTQAGTGEPEYASR